MRQYRYSTILVTYLFLFGFVAVCPGQIVEINGIVIAHSPCISHGGSEPMPIQTLLVLVKKVISGKVTSNYIIASCYYQGDDYIKPENFDGKSIWYFKLDTFNLDPYIKFRDALYTKYLDIETEKLIREEIGMLFLVDQKVIKDIGVDTMLPCYRFSRDDYKVITTPVTSKKKTKH